MLTDLAQDMLCRSFATRELKELATEREDIMKDIDKSVRDVAKVRSLL